MGDRNDSQWRGYLIIKELRVLTIRYNINAVWQTKGMQTKGMQTVVWN